jgi:hypothetical protein
MKKKMRSVLALTIVTAITNISLGQENSSKQLVNKKYSIGVGTSSYDDYGVSLASLNLRKHYQDFNLKVEISINTDKSRVYVYQNDVLYSSVSSVGTLAVNRYSYLPIPITNPDSSGNFIAESGWLSKEEKLNGIRFGIEKQFKLGLVNFICGVDGILNHYKISSSREVNNYQVAMSSSGSDYLNPIHYHNEAMFIDNINQVKKTTHFLNYGVALNMGVKLNITNRIFLGMMFSYDFMTGQHIKTETDYTNDNYKDRLNVQSSNMEGGFRSNLSINYKF